MSENNLLSFLLVIILFSSCSKGHKENVAPDNGSFVTYKNVVYGTDTAEQDMDVYLPVMRDAENTPVVILIHGGSWVQGSKADFNGLGLDTFFTANDCALININYRLDVNYRYPAPVEDIGLVMDYIKQKAGEWKINPNRVCLYGRSSGSQLALIYAYSHNTDKRVKVVIDGFGPTDFLDSTILYNELGINVTSLLGPYRYNQQAWHDASPIFFMQGAVPTFIFQGSADELVFPIQSEMLRDSLRARNIPCMLVSFQGAGHGWDASGWIQWKDATMKWIRQYL